ncbi:PLP-dependent aminotransferase family protein [Agromyces allii]|uniref:aminotransferase-like domain-containing protein n=1 Tax=Agromyces allii TaxID=393607 RepID=UPI00147969D3|nr:PLP-dependent aminotransferase family protein [Agromyces allii]
MRVSSGWSPRLAAGTATTSERLVSALAEDILDGVVAEGERLPPHRALAEQLGVALGTVTKAYAELGLRGLVRGTHGRGTFVSYRAEQPASSIDLAMNMPPRMLSDDVIAEALAASAHRVDAEVLSACGPPGGRLEYRRSAAAWIAASGLDLAPEDLVLAHGAQQGIAAVLMALSSGAPGGRPVPVFTEEVTFHGALSYARLAGHRLHGVPVDRQGMRPDLLDRRLHEHARAGGPRPVVYVTPTLQNPTAATMCASRRRELVRVARLHDVFIIEDDVYALSEERSAPALVSLAPERTFHVSSASKALSPAIRVGMIKPPCAFRPRIAEAVRALGLPVSPLICVLLDELVSAGIATTVRASIRDEGARRIALARDVLGPALFVAPASGYHVYLPMAPERARSVARSADAAGVLVTDPDSMLADLQQRVGGVRLSLGAPTMADLARGLSAMRDVLGTASAGATTDDTGRRLSPTPWPGSDRRPAPVGSAGADLLGR